MMKVGLLFHFLGMFCTETKPKVMSSKKPTFPPQAIHYPYGQKEGEAKVETRGGVRCSGGGG